MSEESVAGVDLKKQFKKGKKAKPDLLRKQDLATLDVNKLTPLSPEVISRQATINIGTIGHVAHGKSTIVRSISGVKTTKHSSEMVRNITIRLGYANGKIFQCQSEGCARPASFTSAGSSSTDTPPCEKCGAEMLLVRHVSFVDCFTTDHQILTSRGFMFMDEMRAALEEDPALLAASYDHETHELVYERPLKFVYNEPKEQKMVEFTQEAEKTRWDGASDGEGTNGLSLIVTPGHDMFAKTGRVCADDSMINWSKVTPVGDGADSKKRQIDRDFDKLKAKDLINSDPKHAVQFLGIAEAGIRVEAEEEAAFMATLGLTTDAQADAFLRLYGFSLGNSGSASVLFSELKQQDLEYIRRQLAVLGLAPGSDYKEVGMSLEIVNQRWAGYFRSQCQAFQAWVWTLQKEKLRLIIEALCFADGEQAVKENAIYTSSAPFRDELVRVLLNAGYSPFFTAQDVAGTKSWKVSYAETAEDYTSPNLRSAKDTISEVDYSGATWCLSMPHGMVVVRRAVADECGVVTRASRPIITGNCPGHDILMATMLTGAAVMDAALLLVAANESCPQPQTSEHLAAIEIMKLKQIIILQNKIDLVKESAAIEQYKQILNFIEGTVADGSPIVPVSAQLGYNIDVLCEYIVNKIPVPTRDFLAPSRLIVIRSFDVNRPGTEIDDLQGGIAGGSLMQGVLKVGDEIEVRPGVVSTDKNGAFQCTPIFSKIVSLFAEENTLQYAVPGGLIGVGTRIDPTLCRADRLVGQVLGAVGTLPDIYVELEINFYLLRRLLGVKMDDERKAKVDKIRKGESLMINVGSTSTGGRVSAVKGDLAMVVLSRPVCTEVGEKVAISRRVAKHWRLIGWANIVAGKILEPSKPEEVSGTVVLENDKE